MALTTKEPYLAHCHIMEHEDNSMMAWFQLTDVDDDSNAIDDGKVVSSTPEITNAMVIWYRDWHEYPRWYGDDTVRPRPLDPAPEFPCR